MIKLLLDSRMIDFSGIGTYLQNLIPFLKKEVNLILLGNKNTIENYIHEKDLKIIPIRSSIYFPYEQIEFLFKIRSVDIFWSPHFNVPIFPIRAKKRIVTIHDIFHLAFKELYSPFERVYIKLLINSALNLSDMIITVSNFSKSEIIKYTQIKEDKIKVIYNGVNKEKFKVYDKKDLEKIRLKYRLPDRFILFVGNIKPHKNLKGLLKAFKVVIEELDEDLFLVITGKQEGFLKGDTEIFKLINTNPLLKKRIFLTGYINEKDLPILYNLAELFIFPSFYEGFGLPPLEAMACGCPTVVSRIPPLLEICGDATYYVDPYNINDIAKGIIEVLSKKELRETLIKKGFERVKLFSWENSAKEHLKLIKEIL